jgi:hypothetical protein
LTQRTPGFARRPPPALIAALALLAVTIGFYWKLTLTNEYTWFNQWDMCALEIPRLQFEAREIHAGRFPLWDPHIWAGQPLLGQTQPGPIYPLNLLLALLPLQEGGQINPQFLNWYYVLIHFQAAFFLYLLCRECGSSPVAAAYAGGVFSFAGFFGAIPWLDLMNGAVWAPLVFLYLFRTLRNHQPVRSAAYCGLFLGIAWLSGHHEIPLLLSAVVAAFFGAAFVRSPNWQVVKLAGASLLISVLISGAQLIPTYEFGKHSKRWVEASEPLGWDQQIPYTVHAKYSLAPQNLLGFVLPGDDLTMMVGATVVALAIFGLLTNLRRKPVRWIAILFLIALAYALGANFPFHGILYSIMPMLGKARTPIRAIFFCTMALALLAAFGLDQLKARLPQNWSALFCGILLLTVLEIDPVSDGRIEDRQKSPLFQALYANGDIAAYLRAQPGPLRVSVNSEQAIANFGDVYGIDMPQGFVAGASSNIVRQELHSKRTQDLFAVTHHVGRDSLRPEQQEVFTGKSGLKVFRNPDPMPRAWVVHNTVLAKDDDALRTLIQSPGLDFHKAAVLLGESPQLETCDGVDAVALTSRTTDSVTLKARMQCRGLVILADANFPGWVASVDGRPAKMLEPYGSFRGVVVGAGDHRIEMRYRPVSVYAGGGLTVLGFLAAGFLIMRPGK